MNDHVMNAKITVGVSCPQGTRRRAILHKSVSLSKNTRTPAEAEAAASEQITMDCIKHTLYFSLRIKHTHHFFRIKHTHFLQIQHTHYYYYFQIKQTPIRYHVAKRSMYSSFPRQHYLCTERLTRVVRNSNNCSKNCFLL